MNGSEAFSGGRAQMAWIIALIISTAAIIQLERVDTAALTRIPVAAPPEPSLHADASELLTLAETRFESEREDPQAAAQLLQALAIAVQAGVLDHAEGRARAENISAAHSAKPSADWLAARTLAALTFRD